MPAKKKQAKFTHPIRRKLKELHKTVEWLAGQVGCCSATIRNYMYGRNNILPGTLRKICTVLGITQNFLYGLSNF